MGKEEILNLNTFLLAGIPEIITQEEFDDVKKAIFEMLKENKKLQQENKKLHHYKTLYQSLKRQKEDLKEDISFCLKSIKQEMEMSTDSRTRGEMKSCYEILERWNKWVKK